MPVLNLPVHGEKNWDTKLIAAIDVLNDAVDGGITEVDQAVEDYLNSNPPTVTALPIANVSGLQAALDAKALASDVTTALAGKQAVGSYVTTSALTTALAAKQDVGDFATHSDLSANSTSDRARANHTGTQTADTIVDGGSNKVFTAAMSTKLAGIQAAATANDTDANLKNRANHTGSQLSSTISDLTEAVQDIVGASIIASTGISVSYNDGAGTITITNTGGAGGLDAEAVRDTMGVALVAGTNIGINVNDAADSITISTNATQNSADATLLARANHTGTQLASTISDFSTAVSAVVSGVYATSASLTSGLAGKVATTVTVNGHALSANVTVTASDVGLGSVSNTADSAKPVSTAQAAAIAAVGNTATISVFWNFTTGAWPNRPDALTTHMCEWFGPQAPPSTTGYAIKGIDKWTLKTVA